MDFHCLYYSTTVRGLQGNSFPDAEKKKACLIRGTARAGAWRCGYALLRQCKTAPSSFGKCLSAEGNLTEKDRNEKSGKHPRILAAPFCGILEAAQMITHRPSSAN
jgi:hypothetical protein